MTWYPVELLFAQNLEAVNSNLGSIVRYVGDIFAWNYFCWKPVSFIVSSANIDFVAVDVSASTES